jgi:beta-glucosidase
MPWLDKVKGVINLWWPGDKGGEATIDVLTGRVSPAGRLPFTWGYKAEDYPAGDPAFPERGGQADGVATFSEGVNIGYRWFDATGKRPLYPFGYGLSYTRFDYCDLSADPAPDGGLDLQFDVVNAGERASDEVPQAYLSAPAAQPEGVAFAKKTLVGFDRIHLKPGQKERVSMHVPLRSLQYWDKDQARWVRTDSDRTVFVGGSSDDLVLSASVR